MKITELAVHRGLTVFTLMAMVLILGVGSYIGLPRESSPDVKIPYVMVIAPYLGASPADIENLVTRKLEQQLKGIADLEEMVSTSSEGSSLISLEFNTHVEMSDALQKVRDAVEMAKPELPDEVRDDLVIQELSSTDWPILTILLSAEFDPIRLKEVAEDVQDELERVKGVLAVNMNGAIEQELRVDVDPERLRYYGLSLQDVIDAVALENVNIPGGSLSLGTYDYQVRVPGEFASVDEVPEILLNPASPDPVYLGDVAQVRLALAERETLSRLNGVECVSLSVTKRSGENIIRIVDEVNEILTVLEPTLPEGTSLSTVGDQAIFIRDMVKELENNILSGLILVVAVLFLFLGWTNSFFVGSAIPFSMLITFMTLRVMGYTLNMVVLFSLIMALGMLVDNAIVVVENIFRHRSKGKGRMEAALDATHQVTAPVLASTLTTICAFGPLVFWPGIMGEFMKYLPITVIITLVASLFVALVFNPVLCATFMRVPKPRQGKGRLGDRIFAFGLRSYEPVVRWTLRRPVITLGGMFLLLVLVIMLFGRFNAGVELFPDTDPTFAYVNMEAPSGTRVELSDDYARTSEAEVAAVPELIAYWTDVGSGGADMFGSSGSSGNLATVSMEFLKFEDRQLSSRESLTRLRERMTAFTGAELTIDKQEEGPPTGPPINIEVTGEDFTRLGGLADEIMASIRSIPGMVDLESSYDRGRPEVRVIPDPERAARLGLRTFDLANTLRNAIHGAEVGKYRVGEDEYEIMVRLDEASRSSVEDIEAMTLFYEGEHIPLTAFADVEFTTGLGSIARIDSRRVVTVSADVAEGFNGNALLAQVQERLTAFDMPAGYHLNFTGESEEQAETNEFLFGRTFPIVIMLIMLVLITQFTSITIPIVIISSVILSFIGVFAGLMIHRTPFGIIMTGVGVISLAGVVVNNAIVLLDYIVLLRKRGMDRIEAIVEAGKVRFRPVILTAITTVLGLIPLTTGLSVDFAALFTGDFGHALRIGGESSQWWGPMGLAVIWGLSVATFLTLVVVPVMYSTIDPAKARIRKLFGLS